MDKLIKSIEANIQRMSEDLASTKSIAPEQAIAVRDLSLALMFLHIARAVPKMVEDKQNR